MSRTVEYQCVWGPLDGARKSIGWASPHSPGVVFVVMGATFAQGIRHRYLVCGDRLIYDGAERFMEVKNAV